MNKVNRYDITRPTFAIGGKSGHGRDPLLVLIDQPGVPAAGAGNPYPNNMCVKTGDTTARNGWLRHPRPIGGIAKDDAIAIDRLSIPIDIAFKAAIPVIRLATDNHRLC